MPTTFRLAPAGPNGELWAKGVNDVGTPVGTCPKIQEAGIDAPPAEESAAVLLGSHAYTLTFVSAACCNEEVIEIGVFADATPPGTSEKLTDAGDTEIASTVSAPTAFDLGAEGRM